MTLTLSYAYFGASLASIAGAGEPAALSGTAVPDALTASPLILTTATARERGIARPHRGFRQVVWVTARPSAPTVAS
jgi:hypothetical protein